MQKMIANLRKEKARNNDSQMSKKGQTERAIRTLEYKLDRVSCVLHKTLLFYCSTICIRDMNPILLFSITKVVYFLIIQALTHFSEQMAKNSQLRKELRTLHVEQIRFQQLRTRLEKVRAEMFVTYF